MKKLFTKHYQKLVLSIACLFIGITSGYLSHAGPNSWYNALEKPIFNPPSWIFSPVWTMLYLMTGWAFGIIWEHRSKNKPLLVWFIIQYLLNIIWSPLFFYFHRIDLALYDLGLLWFSLLICMILANKLRNVLLLLLPYMLWVSFALWLNLSIYLKNIAIYKF